VLRGDPGDLGGGLQLLAQSVVFQGEPLDIRDGQVEVLSEFVVVPPQLVVPALSWSNRLIAGSADAGSAGCPLMSDVGGDVGKVTSERGVGQPEPAGQRQDGRGFAGGRGQFLDGQLDVFDGGQGGAAGHAVSVSGVWRSRN
jgi:hypothetical protein